MIKKQTLRENELAGLARECREHAGKSRAQAARDMGVSQTSVFQAEKMPEQALTKLRIRMIEAYSPYTVSGPVYYMEKKKG